MVTGENAMGATLRVSTSRRTDIAVAIPVDSARWTVDAAILRVLRDYDGIGLEDVVEVVTEEALDRDDSWDWRRPDDLVDEAWYRREAVLAMRRMFGTAGEPDSNDERTTLLESLSASV